MAVRYGLLVDISLCVGCHTCEITCKQENNVPFGKRWIHVAQIGPKRVDGRLRMEFIPFMSDECTLCRHRIDKGLEPACVSNCPTRALKLCDETEMLRLLRTDRRYQVCKVLEETNKGP